MSPTIALKYRLNRIMQQEAAAQCHRMPAGLRKISIGSDADLYDSDRFPNKNNEDPAVQLLLSISSIVTNEMNTNGFTFDEDEEDISKEASTSLATPQESLLTPRVVVESPLHHEKEDLTWSRLRAVSFDSPTHQTPLFMEPDDRKTLEQSPPSVLPALVSPMSTPVARTRPIRRTALKLSSKAKREQLKLPKITAVPVLTAKVKDYKKKAIAASAIKGLKLKVIGRKKFSWKNYPELEAFLVANREEYLRHSALNYTVQQKQYNNRLTEQLLELAAEHGYAFDDVEFSFVTVRDRIRCYFKSYVQSAKKRGITVGYAARKAGLLTEKDLRVEKEGEIVVPMGL